MGKKESKFIDKEDCDSFSSCKVADSAECIDCERNHDNWDIQDNYEPKTYKASKKLIASLSGKQSEGKKLE